MEYLYKLGSYIYGSLPSIRQTGATPKPTVNDNPEPEVKSIYAGGYVVVNISSKAETVVPDVQKEIQVNKEEVARVERKQVMREEQRNLGKKRKALEKAMFSDADGKVVAQPAKRAALNLHSVRMFKQPTTKTPKIIHQPDSRKSRRFV